MAPINNIKEGEFMSKYIDLGKNPDSPMERLSLLEKHLKAQEDEETIGLNIIQQRTIDLLTNHIGYPLDSIEANKAFLIDLPELTFTAKADLVVSIEGKIVMIIKCPINSIASWERYTLAFCRTALKDYQIPYAIVTDSEDFIVIDVLKGSVIGNHKESIPTLKDLHNCLNSLEKFLHEDDRIIREKRILHAFNALRCSEQEC